jgi:uncharacterized membrane protein YtjA (UPF0391 family)
MTTLMEELKLSVREIWQSMGFGGSANTAASVVPVLMLGIVLNLIALNVVDRVHPMKDKTWLVCVARTELRRAQSVTVCVLRQIEGRQRGRCPAKRWTSARLAEMNGRIGAGLRSKAVRRRDGLAFPCGARGYPTGARETLREI